MSRKPSDGFDPLSLESLAESVVTALMRQPVRALPPGESVRGSGIYAIYMLNPTGPYARLAKFTDPSAGRYDWPVYVGKAIPRGSRKGAVELQAATGRAIADRLRQHGHSVAQARILERTDFRCRFLVTAPVWIRLAESVVIQTYQPVWNAVVDGFGNHDPGGRRVTQHRSRWDVLHPGRTWADKLAPPPGTRADIEKDVVEFLKGKTPP